MFFCEKRIHRGPQQRSSTHLTTSSGRGHQSRFHHPKTSSPSDNCSFDTLSLPPGTGNVMGVHLHYSDTHPVASRCLYLATHPPSTIVNARSKTIAPFRKMLLASLYALCSHSNGPY
ncbi:unnamed protein product [Durusdinium trenchii]|uniref:Uncharacterized protein n=1 Tax=Durusdinium trenchii TaxID=1381693 RepID=A0ABP0I2D3_9DINO